MKPWTSIARITADDVEIDPEDSGQPTARGLDHLASLRFLLVSSARTDSRLPS
jgi:hypothetical protein